LKMLMVYKSFVEEYMAVPVITGLKTQSEKFAGAVNTYTLEAMMQDGKALQAGTSHDLGQNFAKAFDVTYQTREGKLEYVWATSWGMTTRLIGALVMVHSDDKGLVLPPKLAPTELAIVPIYKNENKAAVLEFARHVHADLKTRCAADLYDDDQSSPGFKFAQTELLGVPLRLEIGQKEMEKGELVLARRDTGAKTSVKKEALAETVKSLLEEIQNNLFRRALAFRKEHTHVVKDYAAFTALMNGEGGFVDAGWCGDPACEEKIKADTKATIRVLPLGREDGKHQSCIVCGKKAQSDAIIAKAY
jgi:prolyl-tRNA synthetase